MKYKAFALVILFVCACASSATAAIVPAHLESQCDQLIGLIKDGYALEYPEKRTYYVEKPTPYIEFAVVFSLAESFAGGNNWWHYMAAFAVLSSPQARNAPYYTLLDVVRVGGPAWRFTVYDKATVRYDQKKDEVAIEIPVLERSSGDTPNLPTEKAKAIFIIKPSQGANFKEITEK